MSWYDAFGNRLLNEAEQQTQQKETAIRQMQAERERAERLAQRLRELGEEI